MFSTILKPATVLLPLLLLVGCGGEKSEADAPSSVASTSSGSPAVEGGAVEGGAVEGGSVASSVNPVDVLKKVPGCTIGPGVETGEPDMDGNLYASCAIKDVDFTEDGEDYTTDIDVTARAVNPDDAVAQGYEDATPDDSHKVIFGDGFYLVLTGEPAVFGTRAVDVDAIATAVDGKVA